MIPSPEAGSVAALGKTATCRQADAWSSLKAAAAIFQGAPETWRGSFTPDFRVVDETDDYIVVDKPPRLQVHPAKPGGPPTLLNGLHDLLAYEIINGAQLSIINRLDRETSGLVLVAKNRDTARSFGKAMMRRQFTKIYHALVHGWPHEEEFSIDAPLRRRGEFTESPVYLMQAVHPDGAPSLTHCRVLQRFHATFPHAPGRTYPLALVEAHPITGRMHQIRVHLHHAGHPLLGDKLYGPHGPATYLEFIETGWTDSLAARLLHFRHALHAGTLGHPATETLPEPHTWHAPLAPDLVQLLPSPLPFPETRQL